MTAVYHFFRVAQSLDSLEVIGGAAVTTSGGPASSGISIDCLSSLPNAGSWIKHLRLLTTLRSRQANSISQPSAPSRS